MSSQCVVFFFARVACWIPFPFPHGLFPVSSFLFLDDVFFVFVFPVFFLIRFCFPFFFFLFLFLFLFSSFLSNFFFIFPFSFFLFSCFPFFPFFFHFFSIIVFVSPFFGLFFPSHPGTLWWPLVLTYLRHVHAQSHAVCVTPQARCMNASSLMFCQTSEMEDAMLVLPLIQVTEGVWMMFNSDVCNHVIPSPAQTQ